MRLKRLARGSKAYQCQRKDIYKYCTDLAEKLLFVTDYCVQVIIFATLFHSSVKTRNGYFTFDKEHIMKKTFLAMGLLALCSVSFVSCGGGNGSKTQDASETVADDKGVLADLVDVYVDMAKLELDLEEKYAKNDISGDGFQKYQAKLQEYEKKAKELGATYEGKPIKFESSEGLGITFADGVIANVKADRALQVNFRAKPSAEVNPVYAYFLDANNNLVLKTVGNYRKSDGMVDVTLRMAVKGMRKTTPVESWKKIATITKIMVVTKDEYNAGVVPAAANGATKKVEAQSASKFVMTDKGVDKITLGADINKLPKSVEGLYDKVVVKSEYNAMEDETTTTATFTLKGKEVMTAMADEANKVCYVTVQAPGVGVKIGTATFEVGAPVNEVLKASGVKKDDTYAAVYGKVQFEADVNNKVCNISVGSAW